MKRSLFLGVFLAVTLILSPVAFAQEIDCPTCETKACRNLPTIPCQSGQHDECSPEYLDNWQCFIFPVCDCPDTNTYFTEGESIGIRMHILTPGVYWASNVTTITFNAYDSLTDACNRSSDRLSGDFSDLLYFKEQSCDPDDALVPEPHSLCTWNDDDVNDGDMAYPKLQSLSTNSDNDNAFFTIPPDWEGYSYWSVQIPPIRIDVDEIMEAGLRGENVRIRIEFIVPGEGGICQGDCQVICECVIEVATLCQSDTGCIYFPYVVTQSQPWASGIALTNLSDLPAEDMVATFTLTDANGDTFEYTKSDFAAANWSNVLDNMLDEFDGTPQAGQAWLRIDTNFVVDGYNFITDGSFGGSTLARPCYYPFMDSSDLSLD